MGEEILFSVKNHIGFVLLNRPQALHALSFSMFKALSSQLKAWQADDTVHAVVIQAAPAKLFCAGGDVRWVYDVGQKDPSEALQLFHCEYQLDYLTADFKKPYIALMDGVNIGGGIGITLHGSHRVASERFAFCMPEVSIGFFPDIGASHLLSTCPSGFGLYLGLTGHRVNAADSKAFGLIDYTIPSHVFDRVIEDLLEANLSLDAHKAVSRCLAAYDTSMPSGTAASQADSVSLFFEDKSSLMEVLNDLKADKSAFASSAYAHLLQQSPLSLHITFEQLKRAKGMGLADCLAMDYALTYHFLHGHDFYEGVRARLVDKDKTPKWEPRTLDAVLSADVSRYFEKPTAAQQLW